MPTFKTTEDAVLGYGLPLNAENAREDNPHNLPECLLESPYEQVVYPGGDRCVINFFSGTAERIREQKYAGERDMVDFDRFIAKTYGLQEPCEPNPERNEETLKKFREYHNKKWELSKQLGFCLIRYGKGEYTRYILAIKESVRGTSDNPIKLGQLIEAKPDWRERLKSFCEKSGIPFEEPQFILCGWKGLNSIIL